jgi:predicted N-formylglutamate amidohydrolase
MCVLITCEFGGETIPPWLWSSPSLGSGEKSLASTIEVGGQVESTRATDPAKMAVERERELVAQADRPARYAAEEMARLLRPSLQAGLIVNETSSGLIDVTRPRNHRQLLSRIARGLPRREREQLIEQVYDGYRQQLRSAIGSLLAAHGYAIHLSVRSFNLRSRGKPRRADVGLLYDPSRVGEVAFCLDWIDELWHRAPMLRVRRNYPTRGTGESLTGQLRAHFVGQTYLGIEVWLNRAWAGREVRLRDEAIAGMSESLHELLAAASPTENHAA